MLKIKTAVISVSDKTGVIDFARFLKKWGVEIISTGGTAKILKENGIGITPISKITGNAKDDYFDGRMKTISFNYESALLYKRDNPAHVKQAQELGLPQIDLGGCNLYPFEKVIAEISSRSVTLSGAKGLVTKMNRDSQDDRKEENIPVTEDEIIRKAIENIDIGGPCMVRAAAKNYESVAIVVEPDQYQTVIKEMEQNNGAVGEGLLKQLMTRAFEITADYDSAIHTFFVERFSNEKVKRLKYIKGVQLGRYAENWHQRGWLYKLPVIGYRSPITDYRLPIPNIPWAKQVHGGALGYNNYLDAEAALQSVMELICPRRTIAVSIIKHANPCGYATGETLSEAFERAWQGDPTSAFGSVIALTRPLDIEVAKILGERFVEVVVAPAVNPDALEYIKSLGKKKADLRLLEVGEIQNAESRTTFRFITGGLLEQEADNKFYLTEKMQDLFRASFKTTCQNSGKELTVGIVTKVKPSIKRTGLYEFGLRHVKHLKSNAITIVREYKPGYYQTIGMGCGQPNRKDSVVLAGQRAVENLKREYQEGLRFKVKGSRKRSVKKYGAEQLGSDNVALVSDAFFPFRDGIENVAKIGVKYIVEPGGSVRDDEVIKAANEYKMGMIFTGVRKFYH
ncbi:MAG: bifunctional phosphoribosylaminoimidazolecarboxamide formyltransferase/IMP cyclohydrolase PurH [Planctomycetota bacterium]